jgi:hypothetical protein
VVKESGVSSAVSRGASRGLLTRRARTWSSSHTRLSCLAAHAIAVAERVAAQMALREQEHAAALWLDAEYAAVHQGLIWILDHDPLAGLRLAVALAPWWLVRGRWAEGYALL